MSASAHLRLHDPRYLVGHWPLNGHAQDVSGYGNHGTWSGTAAYAAGPFNGKTVGSFGGASYIRVPDHARYQVGSGNFSCSFWLRRDSAATIYPMTKPDTTEVGFRTVGTIVQAWMGGSSLPAAASITAGVYFHVALVRSGVNDESIYVDGKPDGNTISIVNIGTGDFCFGARNFSSGYWVGGLGGFRFYNIGLTGDEIFSLYEYDTR